MTATRRVMRGLRVRRASSGSTTGPVTTAVLTSVRRAMLTALALWNVVLASTMLVEDPRLSRTSLVVMHLATASIATAALRGHVRFDLCLVLSYGVWMIDYLAARSVDDAVTLAACWLGDLLYVASAIALRTRARVWLPLVGSALTVAVIVSEGKIWDFKTASAFIVTAIAVVTAAWFATPSFWSLAETADRNVHMLEKERRVAALMERTAAEAAEDARVVHDTVINTLAAIANGGRGTDQTELVRSRCASDLAVVEGLLAGRREETGKESRDIVPTTSALTLRRTGLSGPDLMELRDLLMPEAARALTGAVTEAIRNVEKHANTNEVIVDISRSSNGIRVRVLDHGTGFETSEVLHSHGWSESVHGRLRTVGGEATISSQPGQGTEVIIDCPLRIRRPSVEEREAAAADVQGIARQITTRACWLVSVGVVAVGFAIELANRPGELTWTYGMLTLTGLGVAISYVALQRRRVLPAPIALMLTAFVSLGFVAAMAGIAFGRTHVMTYQAIGIVPLLIVLIAMADRRWALAAGWLLIVTAGVTAGITWSASAEYGTVVIVGLLPAVGLGIGWDLFQRLVLRIVTESEEARLDAYAASLASEIQVEVAQARRRWGTASLERAGELLRGISYAQLDVTDPALREACATEEQYLRQFLLLNPRSYRMNVWFAHALAEARSRNVRLSIRSGDDDAPSESVAGTVGNLILDAVNDVPRGAALTISWFTTTDGPRLSIVGPTSSSADRRAINRRLPSKWRIARTSLIDQEMVEVIVV